MTSQSLCYYVLQIRGGMGVVHTGIKKLTARRVAACKSRRIYTHFHLTNGFFDKLIIWRIAVAAKKSDIMNIMLLTALRSAPQICARTLSVCHENSAQLIHIQGCWLSFYIFFVFFLFFLLFSIFNLAQLFSFGNTFLFHSMIVI